MKKSLTRTVVSVVAVAIAALSLTACSSSSASSATNLDAAGFAAKVSETGVTTIDVRTASEFAAGHIQGAVNIDVEADTFDAGIASLDKNASYAVYCHSGRRSGIAVDRMAKAGFTHLFNLQNGISDWVAAGYPIVA